jgi:hypothetical protein
MISSSTDCILPGSSGGRGVLSTPGHGRYRFFPRLWWFRRPVSVVPKSGRHVWELQTLPRDDWRVWNRAPVTVAFCRDRDTVDTAFPPCYGGLTDRFHGIDPTTKYQLYCERK